MVTSKDSLKKKKYFEGLSWWSDGQDSALPTQVFWDRSPVREVVYTWATIKKSLHAAIKDLLAVTKNGCSQMNKNKCLKQFFLILWAMKMSNLNRSLWTPLLAAVEYTRNLWVYRQYKGISLRRWMKSSILFLNSKVTEKYSRLKGNS